jgi:GT2 family glycosyltransferase
VPNNAVRSAAASRPRVSVIIPNWNGLAHLETCLTALRAQHFTDFETLLVDNGSSDDSVAYVVSNFPEVRVLRLAENRGFTGACNAGYADARGDLICLLNNDTEADPGWLEAVVDAFDRHPEAAAVASKILLFDRRDHFHAAGDYYRIDGLPGNRGVWEADRGQYDREEPVFSASGGAAGYRRAALDEIGFLDDDFYFSCEDVDLGWRIQLSGWQVIYAPGAVVYHKLKATGGSLTGSYYDGRNFLYIVWKNYPSGLLRRNWRRIAAAQWRIAREAIGAWRGRAARARLRGQVAGLLGLPRMLTKRRQVQAGRRVTDETLMARLSPVDEQTPPR